MQVVLNVQSTPPPPLPHGLARCLHQLELISTSEKCLKLTALITGHSLFPTVFVCTIFVNFSS